MGCQGSTAVFLRVFMRPPTGSLRFAKRFIPRKDAFFAENELTIQGDTLLLRFGRDEFVSFFSTPPATECALPRTAFRFGNIIKRESGSSFESCASLCRADISCEVFTFVDAGSKRSLHASEWKFHSTKRSSKKVQFWTSVLPGLPLVSSIRASVMGTECSGLGKLRTPRMWEPLRTS